MDSGLDIANLRHFWAAIAGQVLILSVLAALCDWSVLKLVSTKRRGIFWASLIMTVPWSFFVCAAGFATHSGPDADAATVLFGGWPLACAKLSLLHFFWKEAFSAETVTLIIMAHNLIPVFSILLISQLFGVTTGF